MAVSRPIDASRTASPSKIDWLRRKVRSIDVSKMHAADKRAKRAAAITSASKRWGVSRQWVKELLQKEVLGVTEPPVSSVCNFTRANILAPYDRMIVELFSSGHSAAQIAAKIEDLGGPEVTRQAIQYRLKNKLAYSAGQERFRALRCEERGSMRPWPSG